MAPGSWGNVEGCILPAPSSRNIGLRRVVGGGQSSTYLQHIGQAWQWPISALSWQHHSAFDGCLSRDKLLLPPSGYQKPPGVEVAILWGLPSAMSFWVASHGKGGWLPPLPRTQLLTPTPVRGELSSWWMVSTHISGMVPKGAFEWCLESIPVQGSRTLNG